VKESEPATDLRPYQEIQGMQDYMSKIEMVQG